MRKDRFGFFEAIGSIILLLVDPNRWNNKKYLNQKYLKANRVTGFIASLLTFVIIIYYLVQKLIS